MCNGSGFTAWQARAIEQLLALEGVRPALLIIDAEGESRPARLSLVDQMRSPTLLWRLYQRTCVRGRIPAEDRRDLERELVGVPTIKCLAERRGKYSQYFSPTDVDTIRSFGLDFILRFAFNIIRGDILAAARLGVWSYHHGDLDKYRGMPACFWEVAHGDPVSGVTLQRLTDGLDNGIVLKRSYFQTIRKSYPRSRDRALRGSTDLPARVCRDVIAGKGQYVSDPPSKTTAPIFRTPTNGHMVRFLGRVALEKVKDGVGWLFRHRQWCVGVVDHPIHAFLDPGFRPTIRWAPLGERGRFLADPFGIQRGEKLTILAEELFHSEQVGRLVAIDVEPGHAPRIRRGILDLPVHASYPFLIEDDGEIYCIPETGMAQEVALFKAAEFPARWERVATLMSGVAALDASVVHHQDRWWMFYGTKGESDEVQLRAMYASSLKGPWEQHSANPLKTDVRGSRPGGTPFVHNGSLYRPAQDGSEGYGCAVVINHVTSLSPTEFSEEVSVRVNPDAGGPYPAGMHTLSKVGHRTLVDGQRVLFVPSLFLAEIRKLVSRFARARHEP